MDSGEHRELWSTNLSIEKDKDYIHYYYVRRTPDSQDVKEREPGRYLYLQECSNPAINFFNRLSVMYRGGEVLVVEEDSFDRFHVSKVTQNIYLGAYPKFEKEIA